jgi:HlyD family secretion protein
VKKILMVLALVIVLGLVGFRLYQEMTTTETAAAGGPPGMDQRSSMLVETATAESQVFSTRLDVLGELEPLYSVEVMSRVSGRLKEVLVQRGDLVKEGELLAVVDDVDLQQQISRAQASISVARASVAREKAAHDNLVLQVERFQALHAEALVSTQDLEDLESRLRVSEAQIQLVQAQVEQAEASLRELKVQQEQTRVYSPLTGFVSDRHMDPGALVGSSVPIVRVIDVSRVKTVVPVSEGVLPAVRKGLGAEVRVDGYPTKIYRGRVTRISPLLNPETRAADCEIEIENEAETLKPGMFARVTIDAGTSRNSLSVPRAALLTRGTEKGVYLLTDQQTTEFRRIEIGAIQGDNVEVLSGLDPGARVVTTGAQKLNDGDKVRIG